MKNTEKVLYYCERKWQTREVCVSDTDPIPSLALPQVSPPAENPVLPIRLHIHDMMLEIPAGTPPAYLSALLQVVRQA